MILKEFGNYKLDKEVIRQDKRSCIRVENCGIGKEAIYLGNYFFSRCKVIPIRSIFRIFKRVAMSKGGFTGKGIFGSIPYIVVVYDEGHEVEASLKSEVNVDKFIDYIKENFPQIKTVSAKQEVILEQIKKEREAKKKKDLSNEALQSIEKLKNAKEYLNNYKDDLRYYSIAAKELRASMLAKNVYIYFLWLMLIVGILLSIYGIYSIKHKMGFSLYITIFGFALIVFFITAGILPTQRYNKKSIRNRYNEAQKKAIEIAKNYDSNFPVPDKYMHFATMSRMIAIIEEGRAETISEAFERLKIELKEMNKDTKLYPDEYEEVIAIKPIFLIEDYN